jgi:hypothetical protein
MSSNGGTDRRKSDDVGRKAGRNAPRYREILAAHLVMSLADLRLKKRVNERIRRRGGTLSRI